MGFKHRATKWMTKWEKVRSPTWLWLLLVPPILLGAFRLRFDIDVLNLLPQDLPVVHGLQLYQKHFANLRELILTLEGSDPENVETGARLIARSLRENSNLVNTVLGSWPSVEKLVYVLVGVSAVYIAFTHMSDCKACSSKK